MGRRKKSGKVGNASRNPRHTGCGGAPALVKPVHSIKSRGGFMEFMEKVFKAISAWAFETGIRDPHSLIGDDVGNVSSDG